jgi:anti-sigma factor RsiW
MRRVDVTCPESHDLHPYIDDELDEPRRAAFADHLRHCSECSSEWKMQKALRAGLRDGSFRFKAPAGLAERVRSALPTQAPPVLPMRPWLSTAAALLLGVAAGAGGAYLLTAAQPSTSADLPRQLVTAHVRSLMADHLEDVKSSDRHTVKPWFTGQIDFSPPVKDFKEQGYPLLGGRLDYVDDRPTAVLIYGRAKHVINLFIRSVEGEGEPREQTVTRRGFHLLHWTQDGLDFWAVSDLNSEELGELERLVRE